MAATRIASRSTTFLGSILRNASTRSLNSPARASRFSVPNPKVSTSSPLRPARIQGSVPRFLRRELSTHQPFHSVVAAACLVSKLPSDVTSYEGRFANYVSPI